MAYDISIVRVLSLSNGKTVQQVVASLPNPDSQGFAPDVGVPQRIGQLLRWLVEKGYLTLDSGVYHDTGKPRDALSGMLRGKWSG